MTVRSHRSGSRRSGGRKAHYAPQARSIQPVQPAQVRGISHPQPITFGGLFNFFGNPFGGHEWGHICVGLLGCVLALVLWAFGAKFSADGVLVAANFVSWFFGIYSYITVPPAAFVYGFLAPIPIAISYMEFTHTPVYIDEDTGQRAFRPFGVIVVWCFFLLLDGGTNYLGIGSPGDDSPLAWRQAVSNKSIRFTLTVIMTAGPELLLKSMIGYIKAAW